MPRESAGGSRAIHTRPIAPRPPANVGRPRVGTHKGELIAQDSHRAAAHCRALSLYTAGAVDMTTRQTKPSIVFVHGLWADGSCFSKVIPALQAEGHEVIAGQYGLDKLATDVAAVKASLGRVSAPAILVGHSYGGTVITAAGTDPRVTGLVYLAALAPDAQETSQSQLDQFPASDIFSHIEVADGRVWLKHSGVEYFAGDLS